MRFLFSILAFLILQGCKTVINDHPDDGLPHMDVPAVIR